MPLTLPERNILCQESQVLEMSEPSEDKEYPTSLIFTVCVSRVFYLLPKEPFSTGLAVVKRRH